MYTVLVYLHISLDSIICMCSLSSASETVAHVTPVSLTVRTEVGPHTVRSLNPCGSSEMPVRNYSAVPSSFISTDSQSVSAVGHRTTAPGLLAGDLLLGPRHSGHTTADRSAFPS